MNTADGMPTIKPPITAPFTSPHLTLPVRFSPCIRKQFVSTNCKRVSRPSTLFLYCG